MKRTVIGLLLASAGLLGSHAARADIFRCIGAGGDTMFTDRPCPRGTRTTDITTAVQVCGSADCERRLEREYREAEERRRAEQEQLATLEAERRRAEEEQLARDEALRRRAEEEARLEALRSSAAEPAPVDSYSYGSLAPGYPIVVVPWWTCVGARCFAVPHQPPSHAHHHGSHEPHPHPGAKGPDGRRGDGREPPRLGAGERPLIWPGKG